MHSMSASAVSFLQVFSDRSAWARAVAAAGVSIGTETFDSTAIGDYPHGIIGVNKLSFGSVDSLFLTIVNSPGGTGHAMRSNATGAGLTSSVNPVRAVGFDVVGLEPEGSGLTQPTAAEASILGIAGSTVDLGQAGFVGYLSDTPMFPVIEVRVTQPRQRGLVILDNVSYQGGPAPTSSTALGCCPPRLTGCGSSRIVLRGGAHIRLKTVFKTG
jgi:hypothetical protein